MVSWMGELTAKPRRSRRDAKKKELFGFEAKRGARGGAEEDADGELKAKERRSSVGFFDIVRFCGFLGGGSDRKVAKVAKGRKGRGSFGVSESGCFFISTRLRQSCSSAVKKIQMRGRARAKAHKHLAKFKFPYV